MRTYNVFIASPGDVAEERDLVGKICGEFTARFQEEGLGAELVPTRWENLHGGTHLGGGQGVIAAKLRPDKCDIVVAMLWKRLGQPSPMLQGMTPTEFEIKTAVKERLVAGGPEVLVYLRASMLTSSTSRDPTAVHSDYSCALTKQRWEYSGLERKNLVWAILWLCLESFSLPFNRGFQGRDFSSDSLRSRSGSEYSSRPWT
ncbi:MAG: hypothetical protein U0Q16_35965 [Bryobacteraceae bacterium]